MTFSHVMQLVPALLPLCVNCIISGTILFIMWGQLKQGVTWLLVMWGCWHWCITWQWLITLAMAPLCLLGQHWNKVQLDSFGNVMPVSAPHDTDGIINNITALASSRWLECNTTFSVIWHCWH